MKRKRVKTHQNVGTYFRTKRIQSGLSQEKVAKALGYTSIQIVSNWERGLCSPPAKVLNKLTRIYKLDKKEVLEFLVQEARREYSTLLALGKKSRKKPRK